MKQKLEFVIIQARPDAYKDLFGSVCTLCMYIFENSIYIFPTIQGTESGCAC